MTLLAPWALWFAAVGAAIVGLYLLKIKRVRQTVPALDFWRQLAGRTKVHSLFERLKRLLSMLLWLAIAACLILALGNPIFALGSIKPQSIAVIIDNSASMSAREGEGEGETRLARARAELGRITNGRPVNDGWLLIESQREPRVLVPWTHDRKQVREAADAILPFAGTGDVTAAVELASQLLEGKPDPLIVVISDGASGEVNRLAAADPRVVPLTVGETDDNIGITKLTVRLHPQEANHHAYISLASQVKEAVDTQLTLSIDGRTHSVELVRLEPSGTWEKTVVIDAPEGGVLRVVLDRPDAVGVDNEAYAILKPLRPARVWLVSPSDEAFFFEQALGAMAPLVDPEHSLTLTIDQFDEAYRSATRPRDPAVPAAEGLSPPDLVVFNNCAPAVLPAAGRFVIVNALPDGVGAQQTGVVETPQLFLTPREHPLKQYLSLNGVRVREARRMRLTDRAVVLAQTADGDPLVFLHEQPERQVLVVGFDVLMSDLPFRNAFPLLLRNAVAYMHRDATTWLDASHAVGTPIVPTKRLPADVTNVEVTALRDATLTSASVPVTGGRFAYTDTMQPGAFRVNADDETAYTAVNLCDAQESAIGIATPAAGATTLHLSSTLFGTMPWIVFAVIAGLLITLEWMTYNFRWTE